MGISKGGEQSNMPSLLDLIKFCGAFFLGNDNENEQLFSGAGQCTKHDNSIKTKNITISYNRIVNSQPRFLCKKIKINRGRWF